MNTNTQDMIEALKIEIHYELGEFIASGHDEVTDWAHEQADSDECVIYYAKAEELYNSASSEERNEAEDTIKDCGGFGDDCDSMAQRFTILAYWITYNRLTASIREQAEEVEEAIREKLTEIEELADILSDIY